MSAAPPAGTRPWDLGPPPSGGHDHVAVTSDGVRIAVTVHPGGPRRVVLLHGLSQQRRFWDPVVRALGGSGVSVAVVDQRGHGDSGKPEAAYGIDRCAADVTAVMDRLGWHRAAVVGHSWGAAVSLRTAADHPDRVAAVVAIDGGVWGPTELGRRDDVRRRLEPPRIAMPPADLLAMLRNGALAPWWTAATAAALAPTFEIGPDGLARTRIGFDRHMAVLDGLLDEDPAAVLPRIDCPAWVVVCDPVAPPADELAAAWAGARDRGAARAAAQLARPRVQRWAGALHDVPLQWPALVAGVVRAAVDETLHGGPESGGGR